MDDPRNFGPSGKKKKSQGNVPKYREPDKQVKKRFNEAKKNWINTQCEEIEANTRVNTKTVHQKIKEVIGKKVTAKTGCILSKDEDIFMEKEAILNMWSEHITGLYHDDRDPSPIIDNDEDPEIPEEEVQKLSK